MPVSKKRKIAETPEAQNRSSTTPALETIEATPDEVMDEVNLASPDAVNLEIADREQGRQERFKALQARAKKSAQQNLKEAAVESQRLATDPNVLSSLARKQAFASHNLLKADTAAAGEDFERKRAWDWTIEESEKWDKRMTKKENHRKDVAFQDYRQDSRKVYKRQLRDLKPNLEGYENEKASAVQDFFDNKPEKANVDRLVTNIREAEETRLRKRRDRGKGEEDGDVTYINDKNKEFNKRLARSYNKYTAEIRDSFERGTMI